MSDGGVPRRSSGFDRLSERIRRWAWRQGWEGLRDVQERAIEPILAGRDVVLASATASGKTEAAFLPLLSRPADERGLRVLTLSPLKALINDQCRRLEPLGDTLGIPVTPWHGDVPQARKRTLRVRPAGILLITPESIEAMLATRGSGAAAFFGSLDYVVVDELHSFIATERGRQLQSLLHRLEMVIGRPVPRVGLSATLGDLGQAARFLRPDGLLPDIVESTVARRDVKLQVRGYCGDGDGANDHLYGVVARGTHIIFANQRAEVEVRVQELKRRAEGDGRSGDAFWAHHGSLAKELREDAETALRDARDTTVVATTTLELGIDVGSVDTIAQLGAPPSVSSMRQRLGRSGRREGDSSVLRIYAEELPLTARTPPQDQLRETVVQSAAMVQLLVEGYNETPRRGALHLSTLVQQVLSLVAQRGGIRADDGWRALCATGPFREVTPALFTSLLRDLADHDLLSQMHDGTIVLGLEGERVVNHYDFYTAFVTSDEYRLVAGTQTIGTLPVTRPIAIGDLMLFAGRRWRVTDVRGRERIIELVPAPGGKAPAFGGAGAAVDDAVRAQMRKLYESDGLPTFVDGGAQELLAEGRRSFRRLELAEQPVLAWGDTVVAFPWIGDRALNTLALMLASRGLRAAPDGVAVLVQDAAVGEVVDALRALAQAPPEASTLTEKVQNKQLEKHHWRLGPELLAADYASSRLDIAGAVRAAANLLPVGG
ncbi:DEAD/DEAH box helicase [Conexibacter woesei]|uniref:DEAD/DEAH box helicase n=1 Tax=Conexibacter woesei TaxID=191495 RepID=UPI00041FFC3F|nr:DEAD/DEAH box helicase [Conexibacter woesei]